MSRTIHLYDCEEARNQSESEWERTVTSSPVPAGRYSMFCTDTSTGMSPAGSPES